DHLYNFQLEAVVEYFAFVGHGELLNRCIFHLSGCPGKLDHCTFLRLFCAGLGVPMSGGASGWAPLCDVRTVQHPYVAQRHPAHRIHHAKVCSKAMRSH
ncbi:hypothetical protein FQ187_27295, partial [Pseudomonas sp. ANT_J28]